MHRIVPTCVVCAALLQVCLADVSARIIFTGDFENGSDAGFSDDIEGNGKYEIVTKPEPVRAGRYSCKYTLLEARRSELVPNRCTAPVFSERWYGFSIFIPEDWVANNRKDEVVSQWHASPDRDEGEDWRSPPLAVRTKGLSWQVTCRWDSRHISDGNSVEGNSRLWTGPIDRDRWTDWVFHVKWSWKEDGLVEVWRNGALVARREGPNCYNDKGGLYFKWGIYHTLENRILYNDELRIGDEGADLRMVSPPGSRIPGAAVRRTSINWAAGVDDALRKAAAEGRPVFLFVGEGKAAEKAGREVFSDRSVAATLDPLICVKVDPKDAAARRAGLAAGAAILDPGGVVLADRGGPVSVEGIQEVVAKGLTEFGPILDGFDMRGLRRHLDRADSAFKKRNYARSLAAIQEIEETGYRRGPAVKAADIRRRIEQKASGEIRKALDMEQKDPRRSRPMFENIKRRFPGLKAASKASERLDALAEKGIVDVEKVRMKANSLLKRAQKLENDKRFADAIERYKEVLSLPTTEYTRMARMALDRLEDDPFVQDAVARAGEEEEARSLLRRAQMWERNNMDGKAAEIYRRIIDEYPDATAVEKAYKGLRQLRRY